MRLCPNKADSDGANNRSTTSARPIKTVGTAILFGGPAVAAPFAGSAMVGASKPTVHAIDGTTSYTRTSLVDTLTAILAAYQPNVIRTRNFVDRSQESPTTPTTVRSRL